MPMAEPTTEAMIAFCEAHAEKAKRFREWERQQSRDWLDETFFSKRELAWKFRLETRQRAAEACVVQADEHERDREMFAALKARLEQASPLITYMTTADGRIRDAAYLRIYAQRVRQQDETLWEIPNTRAATLEGIAERLELGSETP